MFCPFAANSSCVADSRTWPMLPGADWNFSEKTVWMESTMTNAGLSRGDLFEDALEAGLGEDVERRPLDAEPLAARLDLVLGLLAGAVEHRADRLREVRRRLQQQRRLADARLAADEHQRAGHDAAAEHAIELADAGRQPLGHDRIDVGVELRPRRAARARNASRSPPAPTRRRDRALLDHRVPRAASGQRPSHFADWAPHS